MSDQQTPQTPPPSQETRLDFLRRSLGPEIFSLYMQGFLEYVLRHHKDVIAAHTKDARQAVMARLEDEYRAAFQAGILEWMRAVERDWAALYPDLPFQWPEPDQFFPNGK